MSRSAQVIRETATGFRTYWKDSKGKTRSRALGPHRAQTPKLVVSDMLDRYVAGHRVADEDRRDDIVRHLKAFFGRDIVEDIGIERSHAYANRRRSAGISDATIRRELSVLLAAARFAHRRKLTAMPVVDLPKERAIGHDDEVAYYSKDELARLFSAAEAIGGEIEWFVKLLYLTGARRASIEQLRRSQVDWENRKIALQPAGKVATKKRQPIVPILKAMEAPLRAVWSASPNDRLFTRCDYYGPYRALCESVGLAEKANPHTMRHTRATHLLQDGKSIYDVARLLGDTVQTIERVYGHHSAALLAERLDD